MKDEKKAAATPTERWNRMKAEREARGLTRVANIWTHPDDHPAIKRHAAELTEQRFGSAPAMKAPAKSAPAKKKSAAADKAAKSAGK